jgi:membrane carboxypeptidase/penicillin-binding protein PbpC
MRDTFAVRAATPLWAAIMQELLRRDHPLDPPVENEKLARREICKTTGLLPSRFTPAKMSELFLAGTEPREDSKDYFTAADGRLLLPNEYSRWCASRDNTIGARVRSEARITNPPSNARYEVDPALPRSQQMVELTSDLAGDVKWFVNGALVSPRNGGRFFWQLAPGKWKVRAVSRTAVTEEEISVEAAAD